MPDRIPTSRCVPLDSRVEMIANVVNQIVDSGITLTAGDAIDSTQLASNIVEVLYDNTTISLNGSGQLQAITASALTEGCGIDITAGVISAAVDGTTIVCSGGNLSVGAYNFGTIAVSGQTDVVADVVSDTLTFVGDSFIDITTSGDTVTWTFDTSGLAADFTGGAGITISSLVWSVDEGKGLAFSTAGDSGKLIADVWTGSHLGFTDGSGADDATDAGKIAIQWHEISGYDSSKDMLIGHESGATTKPVVMYKTVAAWIKTLPNWDATKVQILINDGGNDGAELRWIELKEGLKLLTGWDSNADQSIGHDAAGDPEWQNDSTECP